MKLVDRLLDAFARRLATAHHRELHAIRREVDELRNAVVALSGRADALAGTRKQLEKVLANQKIDEKYRMIFRGQLAALLRASYLSSNTPAPHALQLRRFRLRSQNEEDGIVLALLDAAGVCTRRFIEIGSGGTGGNSAVLAGDLGWSGLMVDASKRAAIMATHEFKSNPGVTVVRALVTSQGVNALLEQYGFAVEVDLLSIDIDSIEYWVLDAISACTARVLVVEYNAWFGPTRSVTLPDVPPPQSRPREYFGASLTALTRAADRRGYRLVLCEYSGVNAFFVRKDLAPDVPTLAPEQAFRPFRHRLRDDDRDQEPDEVIAAITQAGLPLVEV